MAASRKLQGEIERCLKKVTEGVDTFEDIWQKVHNAANSNQKEKYETDLKKEIKKLQRLRDQIKSWIASAEIKDKTNLIEYRKLIETQMERFKVVERETKTKAYSKEGLGAIQKVDPVRKERQEASCWLVQSIDSLNLQVDKFESELELLIANNKKKRDKDKQDRIEGLKTKLEKHRFHIKQLEMLLRMLDNMSVEPDQIRKIKDDIEYYIESAFDMDFHDNEYIYDDIMGAVKAAADAAEAAGENEANGEDESEPMSAVIDGMTILTVENTESSSIAANSESVIAMTNAVLIENHSNEDSNVTTAVSMEEKKKEKEKSIRSTPVTSTVTTSTTNIIKPTPVKAGNAVNATTSNTSTNSSSSSSSNVINPSVNNINSNISNSSVLSAVNASAGGVRSSAGVTATNLTSNIVNANSMPAVSSAAKSSLSSSTIVNHSAAPIPVTSTVINTTVGNFATVAASNPHHSSYPNKPSAAAVLAANLHSHAPVENGILPSQPHMKDSSSLMSNVTATAQSYYSSAHPNSAASSVPSSVHSLSSTPASCDQHNNIGARSSTTTPSSLSNAPSPSPRTPPISQQIEQHASSIPQHNSVFEKNQSLYNSNATQNNFTINVKGNTVSNNSNNGNSSDGNIDSSSRSNCSGESSASGLSNEQANEYYESLIPPLLGVAPLGAIPLDKEYQMQYAKLEAAFSRMPHPSDTERTKPHLPRIPCKVPEHYTEVAVFNCDTIEFFLRLTPETLFFIFYYMEGTKAQFLAAQALKKQSWRFHTKYMMWFQRHEEPKTINDDFEQGTYIYFDFEKWSQRKKEGFTFEYKYLEDKEF